MLALLLASCVKGDIRPSSASASEALPSQSEAQSEAEPAAKWQVDTQLVTIPAPSLANNLIGEAAEREISVSLPPSYHESGREYPVLYYLTGYSEQADGRGAAFHASLETLYAAGAIGEMIVVVVCGANRLGGSWYVNSPVTGNWRDFVVDDAVRYVDGHYRTVKSADGRGLMGHSMGGFGALAIAMENPGIFGAVYAMSPAIIDDEDGFEFAGFSFDFINHVVHMYDGMSLEEAAAQYVEDVGSLDGSLYWSLSYASAFVPDEKGMPPYALLPAWSEEDGWQEDDVWQQYLSGIGNLAERVEENKDALLQLRGLVVDYGEQDQLVWIPTGCEYLAEQLEKQGIPHRMEHYEGDHNSHVDVRIEEIVLPYFSGLFSV